MDVSALKKQFAAALYTQPLNPFQAALDVFGEDIGSACKYAVEWLHDAEVLEEIESLKNAGDESDMMPDKLKAASLAWELANCTWLKGTDRVNALRLFAEIAGHMPDKTINKNIKQENPVNRVMLVKDHGDNSEWEQQLLNQQARLVNG